MTVLKSIQYNSGMSIRHLLTTKLHPPPLSSKLLTRPHLLRKLDDGLEKRLILVAAPAGYGKTSLVRMWLSKQTRPSAWLSLDREDNDPAHFLAYLIGALQRLNLPGAERLGRQTQSILQTPQQVTAATLITPLINEITQVSAPFLLILDDYHLLRAAPIHDYISLMLQHMLPTMCLVIVTREEPSLPLARLRAHGEICEIGTADLRFSLAESNGFLQEKLGLALEDADIARLQERTEGWVVALRLAAKALQESSNKVETLANFNSQHRPLFDYFVVEALQAVTQEQKVFLLSTSILDRLSSSLCAAVLGDPFNQPHSQTMLESFCQSLFFLEPLDDRSEWFRYHPLFQEFFQTQLRRQISSQEKAELHKRAAQWHESHGSKPSAIRHLLAAGAFEKAADLIEQVSLQAWLDGDFAALRYWFVELPDDFIAGRSRLCLYHAWVLAFDGEFEQSKIWLKRTTKAIELAPENRQAEYHALYTIFSVMLAFKHHSDPTRTVLSVEQALRQISPQRHHWRALAFVVLSYSLREVGNLATAEQMLFKAETENQQVRADYLTLIIVHNQVQFHLEQGYFKRAKQLCERILSQAQDSRLALFLSAVFHNYLGEIYLESNQLQTAEHHFNLAYEFSDQLGRRTSKINALVGLLWLNKLLEKKEQMRLIFDELDLLRQREPNMKQHPGRNAYRAFAALERGEQTAVNYWLASVHLPRNNETQSFVYLQRSEYIIWAYVQLARGNAGAKEAVPVLRQLTLRFKAGHKTRLVIELLALLAAAQYSSGDLASALDTLQEALKMAEAERFQASFLLVGQPMRLLLQEAQKQGLVTPYVRLLLLGFEKNRTLSDVTALPKPLLSDRERELLELVAAGLYNRQIAKRLHISINTVKAHLKKINTKLDVGNRTAAVTKAQELGLL